MMAVVAGGLRHLSTDYGPPLSVPVVFIFLMASAEPPGHGEVLFHSFSTWAGGALGISDCAVLPQHPTQEATAECWRKPETYGSRMTTRRAQQ
jgi:hypothetical protein